MTQRLDDTILRVVTMPAEQEPTPCDQTYVCECGACQAERADRVAAGIQPRSITPRPMSVRHRRAA